MADFTKDPNAKLDYQIDWEDWLDSDTITASTWTVTSGLTVEDDTIFTTTDTTLWISGGLVGSTYRAVNHITTAAGREEDKTMTINIQEK
jgi:hypothetical protein